ncbi:MAG: YIP1 family protein [Bryobacteraceae bacterium]|nr:YIP1 family protein [Bryobacteraceae bacterium]
MIVCPVCQHPNDDFSITCSSCSSYIQDRVPNLDLFSTVWLMVESPRDAFKKVIVAEHKNFVLFLSLFLGLAVVFGVMWAARLGMLFDNLLPLLLYGTTIGLLSGIPLFFVMTGVLHGAARMLKGSAAFSVTYGVAGWSLVPVMLSVVFLLPLELGTLGLLLFSVNPSAYEVKPVVTMVLVGMDGACILWSLYLAVRGTALAHRIRFITAAATVTVAVAGGAGAVYSVYSLFFL